jgi:hypothetical protein
MAHYIPGGGAEPATLAFRYRTRGQAVGEDLARIVSALVGRDVRYQGAECHRRFTLYHWCSGTMGLIHPWWNDPWDHERHLTFKADLLNGLVRYRFDPETYDLSTILTTIEATTQLFAYGPNHYDLLDGSSPRLWNDRSIHWTVATGREG